MDSYSRMKKRKRVPESSEAVTFSAAPTSSEVGPVLGDRTSVYEGLRLYPPYSLCHAYDGFHILCSQLFFP